MSLTTRLQDFAAAVARAAAQVRAAWQGRSLWQIITSYAAPARLRGREWLQTYSDHPMFHRCIALIADSVAAQPMHIYTGKAEPRKELDAHPLFDLLDNPNPYMTGYDFRYLIQVYLEVRGEAFGIIERNGLGKPAEIWLIPPFWVMDTARADNAGFRVSLPRGQITVPPEDMLWFRRIAPVDPYVRGVGDGEACGDEVEADELAAKWNKRHFYNSARPDVAVTVPGALDGPGARVIEETWQAKYGGIWNASKPAILANGADIKILTQTAKDMDFVSLRKHSGDMIRVAFGIPPSLVGITDDVNRASAVVAEQTFAKRVLLPRLRHLESNWRRFVGAEYDDRLWVEFENCVPEDKEALRAEAKEGLSLGALLVDEYRHMLGHDPLPNGMGQVFFVPVNVIVTRHLGEPVAAPVKPPPDEPKKALPAPYSAELSLEKVREVLQPIGEWPVPGEPAGTRADDWSDADAERAWRDWVRQTGPWEQKFSSEMKRFFQAQQDEVSAKVRRWPKKKGAGTETPPWDEPFDKAAWDGEAAKVAEPLITAIAQHIGNDAAIVFGISWDVTDPAVAGFIRDRVETYFRSNAEKLGINEEMIQKCVVTLQEGYEARESIPQLLDRVSAVYDYAKGYKAERIARTEVNAAANRGYRAAMEQAGFWGKGWNAAGDERTRDTHMDAHHRYANNPIPMAEDFEVGDGHGPGPGEIGLAAEDCNCRCCLRAFRKNPNEKPKE